MNDSTPRCPLCGGPFTEGTTTFTVDLGFGVVVVRDVPARVCEQCGDASMTTAVTQRLEAIVESARANHQEVSITRWHDAVA
ncbi:MAG: type II toxin-antitoxin system MqsA family antitoxin [Spirochaetales bacterium]|nr:type II toxin-antitoxin system MqsA family antitoxin [Spirochaetales bacterium]